jgi:hypothetical protein
MIKTVFHKRIYNREMVFKNGSEYRLLQMPS